MKAFAPNTTNLLLFAKLPWWLAVRRGPLPINAVPVESELLDLPEHLEKMENQDLMVILEILEVPELMRLIKPNRDLKIFALSVNLLHLGPLDRPVLLVHLEKPVDLEKTDLKEDRDPKGLLETQENLERLDPRDHLDSLVPLDKYVRFY